MPSHLPSSPCASLSRACCSSPTVSQEHFSLLKSFSYWKWRRYWVVSSWSGSSNCPSLQDCWRRLSLLCFPDEFLYIFSLGGGVLYAFFFLLLSLLCNWPNFELVPPVICPIIIKVADNSSSFFKENISKCLWCLIAYHRRDQVLQGIYVYLMLKHTAKAYSFTFIHLLWRHRLTQLTSAALCLLFASSFFTPSSSSAVCLSGHVL